MRLLTTLLAIFFLCHSAWGQSPASKADAQFEMEAYRKAIQAYAKCYEQDPGNISCAEGVARSYIRLNDYLHAASWYEKIIDHSEVSPEVVFNYAQTLKSLKLYGKAKYYFERYAAFDQQRGEAFAASCDFAINQIRAKSPFMITNAYFNTGAHDFGLAQWNNKLVFTSFRADIPKTRRTAGGDLAASGGSDIYLIDPSKEADVRLLFDDIADHSRIGPVHFSSDGNHVAITRNEFSEDSKFFRPEVGRMSLYLGRIGEDGTWDKVKPYPYNDNDYSTGFAWLSNDGMVMFFASDMPGGFGGYDLYVSYRDDGKWTEPQNLGPGINTPGHEIAPYKSEEYLYFSSDSHHGLGGQDIFRTKYVNGDWLDTENLGTGVNSPKDDIGFAYSETAETGYFYSDRLAGRGKMDIYKAEANLREVVIHVQDRDQGIPVAGAQIAFAETGYILQTNEDGLAATILSKDTRDDVEVSAPGYYPLTMKLKRLGESGNTMTYEVYVDALDGMEPAPPAVNSPENVPPVVDSKGSADERDGVSELPDPAEAPELETESTAPAGMKKIYVRQAPEMRYAIQVAAFSKGDFNPASYRSLDGIGEVYGHAEDRMTKIRVGYFDTRSKASSVIGDVRAAGYRDAFIVEQMVMPGAAGAPLAGTDMDLSDFKIRLATYAKPGHFDARKVEKIGRLESYKKNDLTIMLLGGFRTLVEAKEGLEQARLAGFTDACIVKDMGGILKRIQD